VSVLLSLERGGYRPGNVSADQREAELANIDSRIEGWNEASVEEIVLHYSSEKLHREKGLSHPPPGG